MMDLRGWGGDATMRRLVFIGAILALFVAVALGIIGGAIFAILR